MENSYRKRLSDIADMLGIEIQEYGYGPHPTIKHEQHLSKQENEIHAHGQKTSASISGKSSRKNLTLEYIDDITRTRIFLHDYSHIAPFMILAQKYLPQLLNNQSMKFQGELVHNPDSGYRSDRMYASDIGGLSFETHLMTNDQPLYDDLTHGLYKLISYLDAKDLDDETRGKLMLQLENLGYYKTPDKLSKGEKQEAKAKANALIREIYSILFSTTNHASHEPKIRAAAAALGLGKVFNELSHADPEIAGIMRDKSWQITESGICVPQDKKQELSQTRRENYRKVFKYAGVQQEKLNGYAQQLFDFYQENLGVLDLVSGINTDEKVLFYQHAYSKAISQLAGILESEGLASNPFTFIQQNYDAMIKVVDETIIRPVYDTLVGEGQKIYQNPDTLYKKLTQTRHKEFTSSVVKEVETINKG